jgi:hypothetical protein
MKYVLELPDEETAKLLVACTTVGHTMPFLSDDDAETRRFARVMHDESKAEVLAAPRATLCRLSKPMAELSHQLGI